ncbi:MAG: hypothetical protein R3C28_26475 [Pirellulaceae bacterium]
MPGLSGIISLDQLGSHLETALELLHHTQHLNSVGTAVNANLFVGETLPQPSRPTWHFDIERQVGVMHAGTILSDHPFPHEVDSHELLDTYSDQGADGWTNYDGGYVIVLFDNRKHHLTICNDRLGVLPVVWTHNGRSFAFAPEAKVLFQFCPDMPIQLDRQSIISFLNAGYPIGARTMFSGVSQLEPATVLTVNTEDLSVERSDTGTWSTNLIPVKLASKRRPFCMMP